MAIEGATNATVAASNLWKRSRLRLVLERTERAQLPVIVLKGAALLEWLYELHERPMADVDVLIRPADRERFLAALAPDAQLLDPTVKEGILPDYCAGQFAVSFLGLTLDVHIHLLNRPWLRQIVPFDEVRIWERASRTTIAGRPALRLAAEDMLLHLVAHAAFHHSELVSDGSHGAEDARRLLERTAIDWELLCELAAVQRLRMATWLYLSHPMLSALVPERVVARLQPTAGGFRRIRLASRLQRAGDRSLPPVLLTDDPLGAFRAAATVLTPSGDWLRDRYPRLPATPLRAIWHFVRVCAYGVTKAVRLAQRGPRPAS